MAGKKMRFRAVAIVDGKGLANVRSVKCHRSVRILRVQVETDYVKAEEDLPQPTQDATVPLLVKDINGAEILSGMARLVQRFVEFPNGSCTRTFVFELSEWEGSP